MRLRRLLHNSREYEVVVIGLGYGYGYDLLQPTAPNISLSRSLLA
jgi:hypothetical protein